MELNAQTSNEDIIIKYILEDSFIQGKVSSHLDEDLFKDVKNKSIIKNIIRYRKTYKKFPQAKELYFSLPDGSEEKVKFLNIMNTNIEKMNKKFIYESVENFFINSKTFNVLMEAASLSYEKKTKDIVPLVKKLQESVNFTLQINLGLNALLDTQEVLDRLNITNVPVPSASPSVRSITGNIHRSGGFYRKELSMYLGQTGTGKTLHLCNDAAFAYKCGYNVLYVTLELSPEFILQRIYSNITDIEYNYVSKKTASEINSLMKSNVESGAKHGQLIVKSMPTTSTTQDVENLIEELKSSLGIEIDILFLDYIAKLKPLKRKNAGNFSHNTYTLGTDVADQLRDLADSMNIAVVSASQVNRSAYDTLEVSNKNTADSAGINNAAGLIIILSRDNNLKSKKMFWNQISKNRFGETDRGYLSVVDYKHFRVTDATPDEQKNFIRDISEKQKEVPGFTNFDEIKIGEVGVKVKEIAFTLDESVPEPQNKLDLIDSTTKQFSEDPDIKPPIITYTIATVDPFKDAMKEHIANLNNTPSTPYTDNKIENNEVITENLVKNEENKVLSNKTVDKQPIVLPEDKGLILNGFSQRLH